MSIKKFRLSGGNLGGKGSAINFFTAAAEPLEKYPHPELVSHVQLPPETSKDIITFGAKYVESRYNLNRAYFANAELLSAYHSIPYKALDIEHEILEICGHLYSSAFVDRKTQALLTPDVMAEMSPEDLDKLSIDVLVGGVVYADRYPRLEGPVSDKAYKISMEAYFDTFDILLENGVRLTLEEADAFGLSMFVDQLLGSFETEEEFNKAHQLVVKGYDLANKGKEKTMEVYKYLRGILFSGGGLVLNPACPSCHILSTSRDEDCGCDDLKEESAVKTFSLDLSDFDPHGQKWREENKDKPLNHQVKIDLEEADSLTNPQVGPFDVTEDIQNNAPTQCPNYKLNYEDAGGDVHRFWCTYIEKDCTVAANRQDKDCYRWHRQGEDWVFDTRNNYDPNYSPKDEGPEPVNEDEIPEIETSSLQNIIESFRCYLDSVYYKNNDEG